MIIKLVMKPSIFLPLALLLAVSTALNAQKYSISGKVTDAKTLLPITYANLSFTGTKTGCISDTYGNFSAKIDTLPVYLVISHIGYDTRQVWLEKGMDGIDILLNPAPSLLKEVEISSSGKPEAFYKDDEYSVLDYIVDNTFVYLLIFRYRLANAELLCKAENGDVLARSGLLPYKPARLFYDCLGYIHVLSADSAYQVYLRKDTLLFPHRASLTKFNATLSDCKVATPDWLYFSKQSLDKLAVSFYGINRKSGMRNELSVVADEYARRMLHRQPYDYYLMTMDTLPCTNAEMVEYSWVRKIQYKPNQSVLEKIGDTLAVFNTSTGGTDLYDQDGSFINHLDFKFIRSTNEKWTGCILADPMTHNIYTTYYRNGLVNLYRINFSDADLSRVYVTDHSFPQRVMICNNYVYYLYDMPGVMDNKKLFRDMIIETPSQN